VAALQRAVALAEMDGTALAVAEHLDLDMARALEIFFQVDGVVAEGRLGLGAGGRQRGGEFVLAVRDLHAAAAAAGGGLDQDRKADLAGDRECLGVGRDAAVGAGHDRNAEPRRRALGLDLVAHQADMRRLGADEMQAVIGEDFGEAGVLGQKAVAGVHGVGAGDLAGGEQIGDVEIAVLGGRRADADALVGEPYMHRVAVGGRMHRNRRDAELLAGAQDPQRDLATIGNEDFFEHAAYLEPSWPGVAGPSTSGPQRKAWMPGTSPGMTKRMGMRRRTVIR